MHVDISNIPHRVVKAYGEIDISNVESLNAALQGAADESPSGFVLDISGTDYIDSAGIQAIISAYRRLRQSDGKLIIVNDNETIKELISIVHLDKLPNVTIIDDLSNAGSLLN